MTPPNITMAEVLAAVRAANAAIRDAQKAKDHAGAASGYEREAHAWSQLEDCLIDEVDPDPAVLRALLLRAVTGAGGDARQHARFYRQRQADQQESGAPAA